MSNTTRPTRPVLSLNRDARPVCECEHTRPWGRVKCQNEATIRAVVRCSEPGCPCAAAHHLLCEPCAEMWADMAERDGRSDAVSFTML